ncbi:MAG: ABC transporter permease subunit [Candidatus Latescibacterota bacterium]
MLKTIIIRELLEHLTSLRFQALLLVSLLLLPASLYVNYRDYRQGEANYHSSVDLHREKLTKTRIIEAANGAFSIDGYRPPSPLSVFVKGLEDAIPSACSVRRTDMVFQHPDPGRGLTMALTGGIDFLFLVQVLFSLIAVLVTHDTVCGEKEIGTLRVVLANPMPRPVIIAGKFIAALIIVIVPFSISLLVGFILLGALGFPLWGGEIPLRIGWITVLALVYIALFTSLGLLVSSRTRNSKTAVALLLIIWVGFIYVIPKIGSIAASAIRPVRPSEVFLQEQRSAVHQVEMEEAKLITAIMVKIPVDRNLPQGERMKLYAERNKLETPIRAEYEEKVKDTLAKLENVYESERQHQQRLALGIARLSPLSLLGTISTELAWTGMSEQERFIESARVYRDILRRDLFSHIEIAYYPEGGTGTSLNLPPKYSLSSLPEYRYDRFSFADTLKTVGMDCMLLVLISLGIFAAAYVSFLKYDVR